MKKYKLPFPIEAKADTLFSFTKQVADHIEVNDDGALNIIDTAGCVIAPHYILDEYDKVYKAWKNEKLKEDAVLTPEITKEFLSPVDVAYYLKDVPDEVLAEVFALLGRLWGGADIPKDYDAAKYIKSTNMELTCIQLQDILLEAKQSVIERDER